MSESEDDNEDDEIGEDDLLDLMADFDVQEGGNKNDVDLTSIS